MYRNNIIGFKTFTKYSFEPDFLSILLKLIIIPYNSVIASGIGNRQYIYAYTNISHFVVLY